MRPSFSTEIGRMRAEEMRLRAERHRLVSRARKHECEEETPVVTERRRTFSLRRLLAFAAAVVGLTVAMATSAFAA